MDELGAGFLHGQPSERPDVQRVGSIIGLRPEPEKILAYEQLHAAAWPRVLETIKNANLRNFTIYHGEIEPGKHMLFSHFEYVGDDFEVDMTNIGKDDATRIWWTYTHPLQIKLPTAKEGEHWSRVPEVQFVQ